MQKNIMIYLELNVLLLAKVFCKPHKKMWEIPYSQVNWKDAVLKTACVRLELPYDIDKHLFNAKGIRPKISYITHIYTCAGIVNIDDNNENKKVNNLSI